MSTVPETPVTKKVARLLLREVPLPAMSMSLTTQTMLLKYSDRAYLITLSFVQPKDKTQKDEALFFVKSFGPQILMVILDFYNQHCGNLRPNRKQLFYLQCMNFRIYRHPWPEADHADFCINRMITKVEPFRITAQIKFSAQQRQALTEIGPVIPDMIQVSPEEIFDDYPVQLVTAGCYHPSTPRHRRDRRVRDGSSHADGPTLSQSSSIISVGGPDTLHAKSGHSRAVAGPSGPDAVPCGPETDLNGPKGGPGRAEADPNGAVAGPSGAVAGPSGALAGPSGAVAGPSGAVAGPSGAVAGPSNATKVRRGPKSPRSKEEKEGAVKRNKSDEDGSKKPRK